MLDNAGARGAASMVKTLLARNMVFPPTSCVFDSEARGLRRWSNRVRDGVERIGGFWMNCDDHVGAASRRFLRRALQTLGSPGSGKLVANWLPK